MQVGLSGAVDAFDPVRSRWTSPHFVLLSAGELQSTLSGAPVNLACIDELRRVALVHADAAVQASWLWEVIAPDCLPHSLIATYCLPHCRRVGCGR
jgi:hypothetical protein